MFVFVFIISSFFSSAGYRQLVLKKEVILKTSYWQKANSFYNFISLVV